jgi:hypothetical protein
MTGHETWLSRGGTPWRTATRNSDLLIQDSRYRADKSVAYLLIAPLNYEYRWIGRYLKKLYQQQKLFGDEFYNQMIVFGKIERNGEKAVVTYLKALSSIPKVGGEEDRK